MRFDPRFRNHGYIKRLEVILCSLENKVESISLKIIASSKTFS